MANLHDPEALPSATSENWLFAGLGAMAAVAVGLMWFGTPADLKSMDASKRKPASVSAPATPAEEFEPLVYWPDLSSV